VKVLLVALLVLGYTGALAPSSHAQSQSCDVSDVLGQTTVTCGSLGNTTRWTCESGAFGPSCQTSTGSLGSSTYCSSGLGSVSCRDTNLGGSGRTLDCSAPLGTVSCSQRDSCSTLLCNQFR
jgi:hypothetical protein